MNYNPFQSIIIFSVDEANKPASEIIAARDIARQSFEKQGIKAKTAIGQYKGIQENSFIIENTLSNFVLARELAKQFNQESILLRDSKGYATLYFIDYQNHKPVELGYLGKVSEQYAKTQDSWTYDLETGEYYAITK